MAIEVGQAAPAFTLTNHVGEATSLADFRGVKNVVVMFYPLAFSGTCTRQFTLVSAHEGRYAAEDTQVLGISVDSHWAQGAFAKSLGLDATMLLADFEPKGEVARTYGVYLTDRGHSTRATFVIDKTGIVRHVEVMATPETPDEDAVMAALTTCNIQGD